MGVCALQNQCRGPRVVINTGAFHARARGSFTGLGDLKETKLFLPHPLVQLSIVESLCDQEVACSASDRQGSNLASCVWRAVSSHHPQEVLLAPFSLYVHKSGRKPHSFNFYKINLLLSYSWPCESETWRWQERKAQFYRLAAGLAAGAIQPAHSKGITRQDIWALSYEFREVNSTKDTKKIGWTLNGTRYCQIISETN